MAGSPHPAFCFYQEFPPGPPVTRSFEHHYLVYAVRGAIRLTVEDRRWTLPPSYAAWIPAETELLVEIDHAMTCCSVLFRPDFLEVAPTQSSVFVLTPMARDMIYFTRRWGPTSADFGCHAASFFTALAHTCLELAAAPAELWRPRGTSRPVQQALRYTEDNLAGDLTLADAARAAGRSTRSLMRHFADEVGLSWSQALRRRRMIRAVELVSNEDDSILGVSLAVGYSSLSAFNKAFREFTGCAPAEFRERQRDGWETG